MSIPSSQSRPVREPHAKVACGIGWSSRKGAVQRLLVGGMLLLAPAHAAKMSPAEYQEATRALQHGAEWVRGGGGHYFWLAHPAMATPPAAGESWYLHTGPGLLPADLLKQMTTPDGTPATQSPDSAQLLNYKGSGGVTWPDHAYGHLLYPRVFALAPPSCKRAVLWNPETSKLDDVSAPSECTASAPGHGYLDAQAASFECLAKRPKPFPLLILLEAQCLAGLLPHPTGKGPREVLQPAIAGMVQQRHDDDAMPLLTPGGARGCHLVLSPEVGAEMALRLQPFGEATVKTWEAYLSQPTLETGSGGSDGGGGSDGSGGSDGGGGSDGDGSESSPDEDDVEESALGFGSGVCASSPSALDLARHK